MSTMSASDKDKLAHTVGLYYGTTLNLSCGGSLLPDKGRSFEIHLIYIEPYLHHNEG